MSNKGLLSFSLISMVYVELILKRKVDWSTFPTTKRDPLQIDKNQKEILDSFDPNSASTKVLLDEVKTKKSSRVPSTLSIPAMQHRREEKTRCWNVGILLGIQ